MTVWYHNNLNSVCELQNIKYLFSLMVLGLICGIDPKSTVYILTFVDSDFNGRILKLL